jgi:hypothetical protein
MISFSLLQLQRQLLMLAGTSTTTANAANNHQLGKSAHLLSMTIIAASAPCF